MTYSNEMEETVLTQYGIKRGLKYFGDNGAAAVFKEIKQIDDMDCIEPAPNLTRE